MTSLLKKMFRLGCGVCCLGLGLGFGIALISYIASGAGLQVLGLGISSGSVLSGLVHVVGFITGAVLFFVTGTCLCASGLILDKAKPPKAAEDSKPLLGH